LEGFPTFWVVECAWVADQYTELIKTTTYMIKTLANAIVKLKGYHRVLHVVLQLGSGFIDDGLELI